MMAKLHPYLDNEFTEMSTFSQLCRGMFRCCFCVFVLGSREHLVTLEEEGGVHYTWKLWEGFLWATRK